MNEPGLTLCSVTYKSRKYLELNLALTKKLNDQTHFQWIVVENTERESDERIAENDPRFKVIEGVKNSWSGYTRVSYHHGTGLNQALPAISSQFVLFIDPDFFIVRPFWIREVIKHMQSHRLSFFGAPYFPGRTGKYRYFPCAQCLFVNLEHVPKEKLDFMPESYEMQTASHLGFVALAGRLLTDGAASPPSSRLSKEIAFSALLGKAIRFTTRRTPLFFQKTFRDVGYHVYKNFSDGGYRSECTVPSWQNPLYHSPAKIKELLKQILIRGFLPDVLSSFPKKRDYSTCQTFKEFGFPPMAEFGWEEYFWRGEPFGFHIRGLHRWRDVEDSRLEELKTFFAKTNSEETCTP